MIAVSSCITGVKCRYNATDSYKQSVFESIDSKYISVCPEMLAGFGIPRMTCEIVGGSGEDVLKGNARIIDKNGRDITERMLYGAEKALEICLENGVLLRIYKLKALLVGVVKFMMAAFQIL